jgi:FRG domain
MSEESGEPRGEPVAEVKSELGSVGRELRFLATTRPLWSTALSAQIQGSLNTLATQAVAFTFPQSVSLGLAKQMASISAIDTSKLLASIQDAVGSPGFRDAMRLSVPPSFMALTSAATYSQLDPPRAFYSPEMTSPGAYFANDEALIGSFEELNRAIVTLISKAPDLRLVWRGHRDAEWGIHSALFRCLMCANGVKQPRQKPKSEQPYPNEEQMVAAEHKMLRVARTDWRFDGMSALETFARIQHAGGPTRLLDVTKNPFIAAWFAVEENPDTDASDGRLIAFAMTPVLNGANEAASASTQVELDVEWGDRTAPWHHWSDTTARHSVDWGDRGSQEGLGPASLRSAHLRPERRLSLGRHPHDN